MVSVDDSQNQSFQANQQDQYLTKMAGLQEGYLLKRIFMVQLPLLVVGILALFFPWVNAFLPTHMSDICLCSFYYEKFVTSEHRYPFLEAQDFKYMSEMNLLIIFGSQFFFLTALIQMTYKIRHCNDDTKIKTECAQIVSWWGLISLFQMTAYFSLKLGLCNKPVENRDNYLQIQVVSYWSTVIKDVFTMLITMYY